MSALSIVLEFESLLHLQVSSALGVSFMAKSFLPGYNVNQSMV